VLHWSEVTSVLAIVWMNALIDIFSFQNQIQGGGKSQHHILSKPIFPAFL
jgi:hypothetical protein